MSKSSVFRLVGFALNLVGFVVLYFDFTRGTTLLWLVFAVLMLAAAAFYFMAVRYQARGGGP